MTSRLFLAFYAGSFAALWLTTALLWRRCQPAPVRPVEDRGLDVVELAALTGGGERAAIAALTSLRQHEVRTGAGATLLAEGPLRDDATELERELFGSVRASSGASAKSLVYAAARGAAVKRILSRLTAAGLLLDGRAVLVMHALWAIGALLVGAGAVAVAQRLDEHTLVGTLASPVAAIAVAAMALLWWIHNRRSGASAAGRRLVNGIGDLGEGLRGRNHHGAFEVAMFGSGVLWKQDWTLATALGIPTVEEEGWDGTWADGIVRFLEACEGDGDGCGGCGCG